MRQLPQQGMLRGHEEVVSAFQRFADFIWIAAGHYMACQYFDDTWRSPMTATTLMAAVVFNLVSEWRGLYRPWRSERIAREIRLALTTWGGVVPVVLFLAFITKTSSQYSRSVTLGWFALTAVFLGAWRMLVRMTVRFLRVHGRNTRNVAFLGSTPVSESLCLELLERPWLGMTILGLYDDRSADRRHTFTKAECPFLGNADGLLRDAREGKIDIVYIGLPLRAEPRIGAVLNQLADTTATVYLTADFFTYDLLHARWAQIGHVPLISVYDSPFSGVAGWVKRAEDLVVGALILLLIAIPMVVVAVAIKLTSPGPVFFRQRRYGLNGKEIRVLKFRSMNVMEDGPTIAQAQKDDPRVTRLGRFLRKSSIDELPQFIQVITGEMSIVGPRPHAVAHNETYRSLIRGYMLRHKVKPGITGWAQVNGFRGETETVEKMEQRVKHDLEYITDWYLGWDLWIIFLTVFGNKKKQNAL